MRISDWSSDVCSSDLLRSPAQQALERMSMSRLIVISNRVRQPGSGAAQGGLAVALSAALRETRGIWVGWSGELTERFTGQIALSEDEGIKTATIDLDEQDIDEYYNGYDHRTLWPLLHYRINLAEYDRTCAGGYNRVKDRKRGGLGKGW